MSYSVLHLSKWLFHSFRGPGRKIKDFVYLFDREKEIISRGSRRGRIRLPADEGVNVGLDHDLRWRQTCN